MYVMERGLLTGIYSGGVHEKEGIIMEIEIKKLTPDMAEEYLQYFGHVAFTDHEEWVNCYCLESHLSQEENEKTFADKAVRRQKARELVQNGIMQGYLVYDGGAVVGWCNAADKTSYEPIMAEEEFQTLPPKKGEIKVIYCFELAPDYRGKGITHLLLDRIIRDAKEEGYSYIEAYPFLDTDFAWQYHGPIPLYEKHGFEQIAEKSWFRIMQKKL